MESTETLIAELIAEVLAERELALLEASEAAHNAFLRDV
jgi:hypothetical protein